MFFLKNDKVSNKSIFQIEFSEGELELYESCLYYVLQNHQEEKIKESIGCVSLDEVKPLQEQLLKLLKMYLDIDMDYFPARYFESQDPRSKSQE